MYLHNLGQPEKLFENVMLLRTFFLNVQKVLEKKSEVTKLLVDSMLSNWYTYLHFSRVHFARHILEALGKKISIRSSKQILGSENVSSSQTCSAETLPCTLERNVYQLVLSVSDGHGTEDIS